MMFVAWCHSEPFGFAQDRLREESLIICSAGELIVQRRFAKPVLSGVEGLNMTIGYAVRFFS